MKVKVKRRRRKIKNPTVSSKKGREIRVKCVLLIQTGMRPKNDPFVQLVDLKGKPLVHFGAVGLMRGAAFNACGNTALIKKLEEIIA